MKKLISSILVLGIFGCAGNPLKNSQSVAVIHAPNGSSIAEIDTSSGKVVLQNGYTQQDLTIALLGEIGRLNQVLNPQKLEAKKDSKKKVEDKRMTKSMEAPDAQLKKEDGKK